MQRRLALAAALVHDPELVLLDEPIADIDPILREQFWERFRQPRDQGRTLLVSTRYVGEAAECDLVAVMDHGRLVTFGTPEDLGPRPGRVARPGLRRQPERPAVAPTPVPRRRQRVAGDAGLSPGPVDRRPRKPPASSSSHTSASAAGLIPFPSDEPSTAARRRSTSDHGGDPRLADWDLVPRGIAVGVAG